MNDTQALGALRDVVLTSVSASACASDQALGPLLEKICDPAIALPEADFGNIQLVDPASSGLRIVVQRGFPAWWVEFWNELAQGEGACGAALKTRSRVIVTDVEASPLFVGKPALTMQLRADVRAVQSTPLVTRDGRFVGLISTHFKVPHRPPERVLAWLDVLARLSADLIDNGQSAAALRESESRFRATQARFVEEQQRLETLLQALPVGVAFTETRDARHVHGNARLLEQFGAGPRDNVSASAPGAEEPGRKIVYQHDGKPVEAGELPLQKAAREGRPVGPVELHVRLPSGGEFFTEVSAAPIRNAAHEVVGAVAVTMDVTERRRAADAREQVRLKDEFLAMLGHELRNPLAAISSAIQLLHSSASDADRHAMDDVIGHQVVVLQRLVDDLLDLSRFSLGSMRLDRDAVSLDDLLRHVAAAARPAVESRHQQLSLVVPDTALQFSADRVRLQQVLANIVDNASKYTPEGGRIELSGGLEGREVVLRCKDSGPGIPSAMHASIFDPLVRADSARRAAPQGLGLGLALVRRLAELHGGSASVKSEGDGSGSEFIVRIPFEAAAAGPSPAPEPAPPAAPLEPKTIALVEDDPDVAQILALAMERAGHRVVRFTDGASAQVGMVHVRPDAVVIDTTLPGLSGFELVSQLRRDERLRGALYIGMSGFVPTAQQAARGRFDHFLLKPIDLKALLKLLVPQRPARKALKGLRTLLVEDHPQLAATTVELLRNEGLDVLAVPTAQAALAAARTLKPKLLLCDMTLPDMPGLELIDKLRGELAAWSTYVAVVTARSEHELKPYARRAVDLGVHEFVTKPISLQWLRTVLEKIVSAEDDSSAPPSSTSTPRSSPAQGSPH
ncbi:MAG: response regulator [Rhizobacter sp.]|nr:response regulator [Rhizobacter sp.]